MIDRKKIKEEAKKISKDNLGRIWLAYGFVVILSYAINELTNKVSLLDETCLYKIKGIGCLLAQGDIYGVGISIITSLITAFLSFGVGYILLRIVRIKKSEFNDVFKFKKDFFKTFLIVVISNFLIRIGLYLIVPGIILALAYSMTTYLYCDKNMGVIETLKTSREFMYGYKLDYFIFNCSFIGWIILSVVTFGVALIWTAPYLLISQTLYYEKIKSLKKN